MRFIKRLFRIWNWRAHRPWDQVRSIHWHLWHDLFHRVVSPGPTSEQAHVTTVPGWRQPGTVVTCACSLVGPGETTRWKRSCHKCQWMDRTWSQGRCARQFQIRNNLLMKRIRCYGNGHPIPKNIVTHSENEYEIESKTSIRIPVLLKLDFFRSYSFTLRPRSIISSALGPRMVTWAAICSLRRILKLRTVYRAEQQIAKLQQKLFC